MHLCVIPGLECNTTQFISCLRRNDSSVGFLSLMLHHLFQKNHRQSIIYLFAFKFFVTRMCIDM